jgi:hypothetical protein
MSRIRRSIARSQERSGCQGYSSSSGTGHSGGTGSSGAHVAVSGRRRHLQPQAIERARRAADRAGRDVCVACPGMQAAVAEQRLDDADVGAVLEQMSGEAVPQRMHGHALVESGGDTRRPAGGMQDGWMPRSGPPPGDCRGRMLICARSPRGRCSALWTGAP